MIMSGDTLFQDGSATKETKSRFIEAIALRASRAANTVCKVIDEEAHAEILAEGNDVGVLLKILNEAVLIHEVEEQSPLVKAKLRGMERRRAMVDESGGAMTVAEAVAFLGITRQAVEKRIKTGGLLAVIVGSKTMIPAFQFVEGQVLRGLSKVSRAFKIDDSWMRLNFFLTKDSRLGGMTPAEALREGLAEEVARSAAAYGEQGAR